MLINAFQAKKVISQHSHPRIDGFVDDDRFASRVHVVVQAEIGRHPVQQHPVVRCHRGELPLLRPERKKQTCL